MLSHDKVWAAIDALAARNALSASGLAKRAGLDSTAFNKSKRQSADGRPRWPSTESLAKVMDATGASIDDLLDLLKADGEARAAPSTVPLIGFAQAGAGGYFDDAGFPAGHGWDQVTLPAGAGEGAYALTVQGDSMLPLYRDGDVLIVDPAAQVRKGDRVVAKTVSGEVTAKVLARKSARTVELQSLNPDHPDRSIPAGDIVWMARIVWASQ
ncbi:helix-turn-helix transcriptional regulator [Aliihoeflea sp. 40Bstr573]|uniref:S24 family peptidase n=1 Tax=Aliihoeflea sp. 40Bstr573 TaxID=2696467 RepID=UPI002095A280|nr:helix-turn-helix transcriptional regulator [Aliihoeflea sp. 40Bstr573]MCO6388329.1 helix-turn-helix transcriptional regulator [Aliihoeflea sp. 40Bstr573]